MTEMVTGETEFDEQFNEQRGDDEIHVEFDALNSEEFRGVTNYAIGYAGGADYGLVDIGHESKTLTFRRVV